MSKVSVKKKVSPGRILHVGRRPKARVIGPDVVCAQPKPPKKPRKPRKPRAKRLPAIVFGSSIASAVSVPGPTVSGSTVRSMAGSLAAAKFDVTRRMLKEEADVFRTMDIIQTAAFVLSAVTALFMDKIGLAVSTMAIGTFAPMLIRRGITKWRDRLMP